MTAPFRPRRTAELADWLRSRPGRVRLVGSGSHQDRLPAAGDAVRVECGDLGGILRLDAGDQTCTVAPGLHRSELDAELQRHGLQLACPGGASVGGLYALDAWGPATVGGAAPRTTLLGATFVLADGTIGHSGARVVKSVAGFDVHKLLVGSAGRLFAATELHLRLVPRPRASVDFALGGLAAGDAAARFAALRGEAVPPAALHLHWRHGTATLAGRLAGRASFVTAELRRHGFAEAAPFAAWELAPPPAGEVVAGAVLPSQLAALLAALPDGAELVVHGGGRFEAVLPTPAAADRLLDQLPKLAATGCIARGAPERRGRGTPLDPGQRRLAERLQQTLDPHGVFV